MELSNTTIVFNMNKLLNSINKLTINTKTFNELVLEKAAINIKNWIKKNSHHKFPKSQNGWHRLLLSHYDKITVKVDPKVLLDTSYDLNLIHFQLAELKQKIIKFMNKKKNKELYLNDKSKLMKIISSFSRFKYSVNYIELFNKLIEVSIINSYDYSVIVSNKRKGFELEDKMMNDSDDESIELELRSLNNVKKRRMKKDLN